MNRERAKRIQALREINDNLPYADQERAVDIYPTPLKAMLDAVFAELDDLTKPPLVNEAMTIRSDSLNPFTSEVLRRCQRDGYCFVKLRDNSYQKIIYHPENQAEDEDEGFEDEDGKGRWELNGQALTSQRWDMISIGKDGIED